MRYIPALTIALLLSLGSLAQEKDNTSIKISTDKVKIEGKYYYIHIVRSGETLYSISKAYNVSQVEIAMENQDIYLGLQTDQALKIPIRDTPAGVTEGPQDDEFIYHVVRRGETLFALSRKYSTSIEDIVRVNPEVEAGIKLSQVVLIPRKKIATPQQLVPTPERFHYHEVKPREGFLALERQYGVSAEIIRRFNPDLVKDGLKLGTILRIPINPNDTLLSPVDLQVISPQTIPESVAKLPSATIHCDTFNYSAGKQPFNIALLLPFSIGSSEPLEGDAEEVAGASTPTASATQRNSQRSQNYLEFYQGALLALDSLKRAGLSVNLWVYDTNKDVETVRRILREGALEKANLIIGPVFPETLKPAADFAREHRIPIVSPLSQSNHLLSNNPFLFQANPSFTTQLEEFTSSIDLCSNKNLVLIHDGDSTNASMINNLNNLINRRISLCPDPSAIHFKTVTYRAGSPAAATMEMISHSLTLDRENLIIVPSNNEVFVTDLLGNLFTLHTFHNYPISLYGFPRWQRFRSVQIEYYYQLQLHLFTPFFVNFAQPRVRNFIASFREHFRAEPSQFAYQGYDVVFYFLSAMKEYGPDFQYCLKHHKPNLLQSEFAFSQVNQISGYENRAIHMIRYTKGFDIIKVNSPK